VCQAESARRPSPLISIQRDSSTQALLREAINDLFAKYGKPPIA
jgi:hypothetical protein